MFFEWQGFNAITIPAIILLMVGAAMVFGCKYVLEKMNLSDERRMNLTIAIKLFGVVCIAAGALMAAGG